MGWWFVVKVKDLMEYIWEIAPKWVNPKRTVDQILFGDPDMEVNGIGVGWMPTFKNLKKARDSGANIFITHEPLYVGKPNKYGIYIGGPVHDYTRVGIDGIALEIDDIWNKKAQWLEENEMAVVRCHDTWDDFEEIGIHGAWAKFLGFNDKPVEKIKYYEVHEVNLTFKEVLDRIKEPLKRLNQECIHYIGDLDDVVKKIAFGTGAITNYRLMHSLGADCLVLTDDGTRLWETGQWAEDSGIKLIIVNHATAEEPGVRKMAEFFEKEIPARFKVNIPIFSVERGCLYKSYH